METGDSVAIQKHLESFKPGGKLELIKVLSIPSTDRIPALLEQENGFLRVAAVLVASLKNAMENLNLKMNFSEDQLLSLAEMIIDDAGDDNLGIEDVLLFLQELVTGKAGKLYDHIDTPTFFQMFETYRQRRHQAVITYRENKHLEYKALGNPERTGTRNTAFDEHLARFSNKLQAMKDELHEQMEENKRLKGKR